MIHPSSTQQDGSVPDPSANATANVSSETMAFMRAEFELLEDTRESLVNLVNQRFNFLLALVSATLIAISFLGNQLGFGAAFFLIASGLLASVLLLGLIVFVRALEAEVMTIIYIRALNRIRNFYVTLSPAIRDYLTMPWYDDVPSFYAPGYDVSKASGSWWIKFTNLPAMIAVINSTLATFLGVSITQFLVLLDSNVAAATDEPLPYIVISALVSIIAFAGALYLQLKQIVARMTQATDKFHVHFKSPDSSGTPQDVAPVSTPTGVDKAASERS